MFRVEAVGCTWGSGFGVRAFRVKGTGFRVV